MSYLLVMHSNLKLLQEKYITSMETKFFDLVNQTWRCS